MIPSSHPKNGYSFGIKWSLVGCSLALVYISACELIVPPDRSVPRYNTVNGEKRRPELNPGGAEYQGDNSQQNRVAAMNSVYYGAAAPVQATSAAPVAPLPEAPKDGDTKVAEVPSSERHRPSENAAASMTVATAATPLVASNELAPLPDGYPDLHTTPEKPGIAAVDNTKQRSIAIRSEMEYERDTTAAAREQVVKDAAAEPSLLANPPSLPNLPPPPPMTKAQAAQVEQVKAQPPVSTVTGSASAFERLTNQPYGSSSAAAPEPIRLTPPPVIAVPAPLSAAPAATPVAEQAPVAPVNAPFASVNVNPAPQVAGIASPNPQASGALEPIRLVPPGSQMASLPAENATAATGTQTASLQPPVTAQRYIDNLSYLPASRYAARRQ